MLIEEYFPSFLDISSPKMALPPCGRKRFAPTGIFVVLQTLFEALYAIHTALTVVKNDVAAVRQEAFRADRHFCNASNFV